MQESRDNWSKVDIVAKVALPVLIFLLGTMYSCHQQALNGSEKVAQNVGSYVKGLYSESPQDRQYSLMMLEYERAKHPNEFAELVQAKVVPSLFVAANDENKQVKD